MSKETKLENNTINKMELAERIMLGWNSYKENSLGINKAQINQTIDILLLEIEKALVGGENIEFKGLFSLVIEKQSEKKGRDFRTGEMKVYPAKKVPKVKFSRKLKDQIK